MVKQQNVTGTLALKYMKDELSRGGVLSSIIEQLPLSNGDIYALVPEGTRIDRLYDFEHGGVYPVDREVLPDGAYSIPIPNDARSTLVEIIEQHLASGEANCCLFEDQLRTPSDPIVAVSALDYVHLGSGQMFYFFNSNRKETSSIAKALTTSEAHVFLCALSSLEADLQNEFVSNGEINLVLLEKFASGIRSFFVNAYDHEGFLMWAKK